MRTQRRRTPLEEAPLFSGMTPEQKRELEVAGSRHNYRRGETLFNEGEPIRGIHVLLSGRLKSSRFLPDGHEIIMHFIEPGQVFAEVPAFLGKPYPVTASALEDAEVFTLPVSALQRLIAREPEIAVRLFRSMATKLAIMLDRVELQKTHRAEERIARYLVSKIGAKRLSPGASFELSVPKKVWAAELGLQPESLSRSMARLAEEGILAVEGRELKVLDPARLADLAGAQKA